MIEAFIVYVKIGFEISCFVFPENLESNGENAFLLQKKALFSDDFVKKSM